MKSTLFSNKKHIRKESCWIISNLGSGEEINNLECLIRNQMLPVLIRVAKTDDDDVIV